MLLDRRPITENEKFIFDQPVVKDFSYYKYCVIDAIKALEIKIKLNKKTGNYTKKKYRVALCTIFKNEEPYLKEWIEFHRIVGIDHFYMYNNNSTDDGEMVLRPYIDMGLVTLMPWAKNQAQLEAYQDGCKRAREETEWLGFIDIDEFVIPEKTTNIYDVLLNFKKRPAVLLYWHLFGTSGWMDRNPVQLVTEDFTVAFPKIYRVGKCFWNTSYDIDFQSTKNNVFHHSLWCSCEGMKDIPPFNVYDEAAFYNHHILKNGRMAAHINHYFTKSFREYQQKKARGDVYFKKNPHDWAYLLRHEQQCNAPDYSAYPYLIQLKLAMGGDRL